ncbi:DNA-3-methyladenine glycosylase [Nocardioides marmoribigeumensis]|uniref:Putative 3-methyladenine DNA glycosylase n=1 Tax=Nocardioides marmoribigeumensis TaxID=433649 RepID=A0ABU2BUB0_9ACTN|nr:DNA-3-methyladenine glycosylase [Nocardioides marmoribigeumensis]MDR7360949.1 DNA-3-methyladenine glycosylase [Nocardioides marmoribigeumensis]
MAGLTELLGRPSVEVAPLLLGAVLRHDHPDGPVAVRLTEVEAYAGTQDPGSHGFRGRTERNATMFGPPAHLYVYFVYGMHHCANVVTGPEGECGAVLVRAGEVVEGLELARTRRPPARRDAELAKGPASLCRALGIGPGHDGADLVAGPVTLTPADRPAAQVSTGPRVGLRHAADRPWRFWVTGDPTVSRYVPAKPRPAR